MRGRPEEHDRTEREVWQPILADFISVESALTKQDDRTLGTIGDGADEQGVKGTTGR